MADFTIDAFLTALTDMTEASDALPKDFDYRFCALDSEFEEAADAAAEHTLRIAKEITAHALGMDIADDEDEYMVDVDRAIADLLGSRDMNVLRTPATKTVVLGHAIERMMTGEVEFIFSRSIPKVVKFVRSRGIPEAVPTLSSLPIVIDPQPPELTIDMISWIGERDDLVSSCSRICASFPKGPVYVAFPSHRVRTYRPFACLCLLMTPDYRIYMIDMLALRDCIDPLFRVFENENIVKVLEHADVSLAMVAETLGMCIAPVLCLESETNTKVVVDWRIRPLTEELMMIAARTVIRLPFLTASKIAEQSDDILRECTRFACPPSGDYVFGEAETDAAISEIIGGAGDLEDVGIRVIRGLVLWRDSIALLEDDAPHFIAGNDMIMKIARELPQTSPDIIRVLGTDTTPFIDSYRSDIGIIVKQAVSVCVNGR